DSAAVRSATAEALHAFGNAREIAITRRTPVTVRLDSARGVVELRAAGALLAPRDFRAGHRVALAPHRDSLVYDPRGLRLGASNLTLVLRRGIVAETLTVSRLGRVR